MEALLQQCQCLDIICFALPEPLMNAELWTQPELSLSKVHHLIFSCCRSYKSPASISKPLTWEGMRLHEECGKITMPRQVQTTSPLISPSCSTTSSCQQPTFQYTAALACSRLTQELQLLHDHWLVLQVDSIVFLVDAVDRERFSESKRELDGLLADEALAKASHLFQRPLHHAFRIKQVAEYQCRKESCFKQMGLSQ